MSENNIIYELFPQLKKHISIPFVACSIDNTDERILLQQFHVVLGKIVEQLDVSFAEDLADFILGLLIIVEPLFETVETSVRENISWVLTLNNIFHSRHVGTLVRGKCIKLAALVCEPSIFLSIMQLGSVVSQDNDSLLDYIFEGFLDQDPQTWTSEFNIHCFNKMINVDMHLEIEQNEFFYGVLEHTASLRKSNTTVYLVLFHFLQDLEMNSDVVKDFTRRFVFIVKTICSIVKVAKPTPRCLKYLIEVSIGFARIALEIRYPDSLLWSVKVLVENLKTEFQYMKSQHDGIEKQKRVKRHTTMHHIQRRLTKNFHEDQLALAQDTALLAEVPSMWVQVDPITNRKMSEIKNQNRGISDEELTSINCGIFRLYKESIDWVILRNPLVDSELHNWLTARQHSDGTSDNDIGLSESDLAIYDSKQLLGRKEKIWKAISYEDASIFGEMKKKSLDLPSKHTFKWDKNEVDESRLSIKIRDIQRFSWGSVDDDSYFLSLLGVQVYKFFPFDLHEITEIANAITCLTGLEAFTDFKYSLLLQQQELGRLREGVLNKFVVDGSTTWISHTQDLYSTIYEIVDNDRPINIYVLERLFHSCRVNPEVLVETFSFIKKMWKEKLSPRDYVARAKILCIVDRLLDPQVINGDKQMISNMLQWLRLIETALDPHSCAPSLKMVTELLAKVPLLQTQRISSIGVEQLGDVINDWGAYQSFLKPFVD